jgi:hypothetical protein
MFFDLDVGKTSGNYYFTVERHGRNYLAETGLRNTQGMFCPLSRSKTAIFDSDRPSGNYRTTGLFVGNGPNRIFQIENMFDAPVYERMNHELGECKREEPLSVAAVFLDIGNVSDSGGPLGHFIENLSRRTEKFSAVVRMFRSSLREPGSLSGESLLHAVD